MRRLLDGMANLCIGLAFLSLLFGGRAFAEFSEADGMTSEVLGLGIAVIFVLLAIVSNHCAERWEADKRPMA